MPGFLFDLFTQSMDKLNASTVFRVTEEFGVSKHAAAIRLFERSTQAVVLVCHVPSGKKSFTYSPQMPSSWIFHSNIDARSSAMEILFGSRSDDPHPRKINADAWFDGRRAQYFDVREQTFRSFDREILTLLHFEDQRMLEH
jgi:hypothetical protein